MEKTILIYCPDCRGRFDAETEQVVEGEVLECDLCGAEILVVSDRPIQVKVHTEEDDFF